MTPFTTVVVTVACGFRCDGGNREQAGQDDQEREKHLGDRGDEGDTAGILLRVSGHGGLDDEEVGAPIAEGEYEAEAHREAEDIRRRAG